MEPFNENYKEYHFKLRRKLDMVNLLLTFTVVWILGSIFGFIPIRVFSLNTLICSVLSICIQLIGGFIITAYIKRKMENETRDTE